MTLRQITREIITLVEERSGIPVRVTKESNLPTPASVRIARRGSNPFHLVLYKPIPGESPDYKICFQCTFILRLFSNPPDKRFDLTDTIEGQQEIEKIMQTSGGAATKYRLDKNQIQELRTQFLNGLLTHLRSVPVGLRVSEWLTNNYHELEQMEKDHVQEELNINRQSLKGRVKELTPPIVYRSAHAINAAYALYWSEIYNKPDIFNPYRLEKFEKDGQALMKIYREMPDDPTYDRSLIDAWGEYLGISRWYAWSLYEPPQ